MNGHAIETCPKKREAIKEIKKYAMNQKTMKVDRIIHKVCTILRDVFPTNPHHEDYLRIIREAIDELTLVKLFFQSQIELDIYIYTTEYGADSVE